MLVVATAVALLTHFGTPLVDTVRYGGYVTGCVLVPGFIVHRSLIGARRGWAEELFVALGTGVVLTLPAWMIVSTVDGPSWLILWPLATLALLIPRRTRARVFVRPTGRWHPLAQVGTAAAVIIALIHLARTYFAMWALPPTGRPYYPDLLWHMGLASEATRSFPLQVPQAVSTGLLRYQWFADADIGGVALMTHIPVPVLVLRLWPVLMVVLAIGLTAVLGAVVSKRASVAGLAALAMAASNVLSPWRGQLDFSDPLRPISPSQLYAFTPLLLAVIVLTLFVRRESPRTAAVLGVLALIVCAGAKPSVMPMLLAGLVVGAIAAAALRAAWIRFASAAAVAAAITFAGMALVAGGDAGVKPKLLHLLTLSPFVAQSLGDGPFGGSGALIPGMFSSVTATLAILGAAALVAIRPLLGMAPLLNSTLRRDPVAWSLSGMCGSAIVAGFVLGHPGYSELYFILTATPLGAVAGAWWLRVSVKSRRGAVIAVIALGVGLIVGEASAVAASRLSTVSAHTFVLTLAATTVAAAGAAVALLVVGRIRRTRDGTPMSVPVLASLFGILIASLIPTALPPAAASSASQVNVDETRAAAWIAEHTAPGAILAVNDQCLGEEADTCDARNWWVSGLGGRRVLLEGWSYTPQSSSLQPLSTVRPVFDMDLWRFNQSLFTDPSVSALSDARRVGIRYLVATSGATPVSEELRRLSDVVYENATVTIYRLRPPGR